MVFRPPTAAPGRQPIFNAPGAVTALILMFVAVHAVRGLLSPEVDALIIYSLGFVPARYTGGLPPELAFLQDTGIAGALAPFVTHAFLHGDIMHLGINSLWFLAFGTPVARRLGNRRFVFFFLFCAVGGAVTYLFLGRYGLLPVIGASGAISGAMAAAFRIMLAPRWPTRFAPGLPAPARLAPLSDVRLLAISAVWAAINLVVGITGVGTGEEAAIIAWEAHLGGFLTGLLLIGPFDQGARRASRTPGGP